jgi:hypothetical protein
MVFWAGKLQLVLKRFAWYGCLMVIEQTVEIPVSRRLTLKVPREIPSGRVVLTFTPVVHPGFDTVDTPQARSRAARQKLRELCKDSKLTVDSFLAMKHADRDLEASIDERAGEGAL